MSIYLIIKRQKVQGLNYEHEKLNFKRSNFKIMIKVKNITVFISL